jgi:hypothetical protein
MIPTLTLCFLRQKGGWSFWRLIACSELWARKTLGRVSFNLPIEKPQTTTTDTPEPARLIENLCAEINRVHSLDSNAGCLGIVDSGNTRHRLWPATPSPPYCYTRETISLEELLVHEAIDKRDRLRLGVLLASGVIQLHTTGWLNKRWTKCDINFFLKDDVRRRAKNGSWYSEPVVEKPFLCRDFGCAHGSWGSSSQQAKPTSTQPLVQYDASIFSLGIVLVELWFGKFSRRPPRIP